MNASQPNITAQSSGFIAGLRPGWGSCQRAIIKDIVNPMLFAAVIDYTPDSSKIAATRPAHREYLKGLFDTGHLAASGPFLDDGGGLLVYAAATAEEAESLLRNDPFAHAGVFVAWTIRPWKIILANPQLFEA
jgi:hypothetical protein